jgi:ABC-type glycerol-3-phosphate transport system substrate-binding protein
MKTMMTALATGAMALSLAACGGKGDDKLGSQVEAAADNRADALEAAADNMEEQAKAVREGGDQQADAIDDADVNAQAMTAEQKAALVNGSAKLR